MLFSSCEGSLERYLQTQIVSDFVKVGIKR